MQVNMCKGNKTTIKRHVIQQSFPELFIQLPKLQSVRKSVQISPSNSINRFNPEQCNHFPTKDVGSDYCFSMQTNSNCSSDFGPKGLSSFGIVKGQKQIVLDWAKKKFAKMNLLGCHWERLLQEKRNKLIAQGFNKIKETAKILQAKQNKAFQFHNQVKQIPEERRFLVNQNPQSIFGSIERNNQKVFHLAPPQKRIKIAVPKQQIFNQNKIKKVTSVKILPSFCYQYSMTPQIHPHSPNNSLVQRIVPVQNPNIRTEKYHESLLQPNPVSKETVIEKRPESHHSAQKLIFSKMTRMDQSQHTHSLSAKKRPVSAALITSCFIGSEVKQEESVKNSQVFANNCKNMKRSMQETPIMSFGSSSGSIKSPQKQRKIQVVGKSSRREMHFHNEYQNQFCNNIKKEEDRNMQKAGEVVQNEYNFHRLGGKSPKTKLSSRISPS